MPSIGSKLIARGVVMLGTEPPLTGQFSSVPSTADAVDVAKGHVQPAEVGHQLLRALASFARIASIVDRARRRQKPCSSSFFTSSPNASFQYL